MMGEIVLAKCPDCGKEIEHSDKSLKNSFFHIKAYTCTCGKQFKVTK